MCSRGVYQLRKINLQFCDQGGSSKGIREFINSDLLKEFMVKNPQINFEFTMRRNKHPFLTAQYINGFNKDVTLKNYQDEEVLKEFERVRNSFGRKALPFAGKKLYSARPSIQGKWTPMTWNTYPRVELQMIRDIKEPTEQVELVDNVNRNVELVNYKDFVHAFLKEKKINEEFNKQNI